jgi:hypothetical protein
MTEIGELAKAISKLRPTDKERLFELLADRGELPARYFPQAPQGEQMEMIPSSTQHPGSPDISLTFASD